MRCSVEKCNKQVFKDGLCKIHYMEANPPKGKYSTPPMTHREWSK